MKNILCIIVLLLNTTSHGIFTLPALPYSYKALEPHIDAKTMQIHHAKHHQAYIDQLNNALKDYPKLQQASIAYLAEYWSTLPEEIKEKVRNNAGGHLNHSLFWQWMTPHTSQPSSNFTALIAKYFGNMGSFKEKFSATAKKVFGSGWVWLCIDRDGSLIITSTSNQDNPIAQKLLPILGLDIWEHAYYLNYQNKRADYIDAWWNVVNWQEVERMYAMYLKKMKNPFNALIFIPGITGDLAKRKIIPALYSLIKNGARPFIIGTSRKETDVSAIMDGARVFISNYDDKTDSIMRSLMITKVLDVQSDEDFKKVAEFSAQEEKSRALNGIRVVYLSTPSESFCPITEKLVSSGLIEPFNMEHRIGYEKPFGNDIKSAEEIYTCITKHLTDEQLYFVDHYLARTMVQDIPVIISKAIGKKRISEVDVFFDETIGVEDRGSFYDIYGFVKDVLQNHMMQMLTLTVAPEAKIEFIKSLYLTDGILGQYEGYKNIAGVKPDSSTDTFGKLELKSNDIRWSHMQFMLHGGKKLSRKATEIHVVLEDDTKLIIKIAPKNEVIMLIDADKKSIVLQSLPNTFVQVEAYENVFKDILLAKHTSSVSFEEIKAQWQFADKIYAKKLPLQTYSPGSDGPKPYA